ncbi:MAG: YggT family protein [SAR202 cluster bacterium]|nr:hypothetical protein [Chloroflexota bacterium]MQG50532.1 YggT family protein [SAR202 cluster bacterium]|tara:strand:- start:19530 stop:19751 length:222 start_codon:yes stop_codon:yes gene_type:complete
MCIFARVILSWLSPSIQSSNFALVIYLITEPILRPIRRIAAPIGGTLDISPIIALLLIQFIERIILRILFAVS